MILNPVLTIMIGLETGFIFGRIITPEQKSMLKLQLIEKALQ